MNEISCDVCMDLIPLVRDGVASEDSKNAVDRHICNCPQCAAFAVEMPPAVDENKAFHALRSKMRLFFAMLMAFGIVFGLSLTAGSNLFYNTLIMPVVGAIGYGIFGWKALYTLPLLLLVSHAFTNYMGMGAEFLDLPSLLLWTGLYAIFAALGSVAAGLIHLLFRKGEKKMKLSPKKVIALILALALVGGLGWFSNSLVGNPISKMLAQNAVEEYLEEHYADTDFYCEKLGFSFKSIDYYAHIRSDTSIDTQFTLYINMLGEVTFDTYDDVLRGSITASRINSEYRALTETVFDHPSFPYESDIGYGNLEIHHKEELEDPNAAAYVPDFAIFAQDLILDHIYDIRELGAQAGRINIYVDSETVTPELAAEMMLKIRDTFDQAGVPFRVMDFVLQLPLPEEGPREEVYIRVENFSYDDIYEEGMVERVIAADAACRAYYEALDAEK